MANCENTRPQEGTSLSEVGESLSAKALCPSYSGGGSVRSDYVRKSIRAVTRKTAALAVVDTHEENALASDSDMSVHSISSTRSLFTRSQYRSLIDLSVDRSRKRKSLRDGHNTVTSEGEDDALAPPKISTVNRGRGKLHVSGTHIGIARAKKDLAKPSKESYRLDKADVPGPQVGNSKTGRTKYSHFDGEPLNTDELQQRAFEELEVIQEASRKSKNLKGTTQGSINQALINIKDIFNSLKSRTVDDETKRLRADNDRLSKELSNLKTELRALRKDYEDRNARMNALTAPPAPSPVPDMEDIVRRVTISVGEMVNARIAGIEDRLLPAKTLRPPLAADKRKKIPAADDASTSSPASRTQQARKQANQSTNTGTLLADTQPLTNRAVASPAVFDKEGWVTVAKKVRTKKPPAPIASSATKPAKKQAVAAKRKAKVRISRTSAVVITLQPEALKRGVTYAETLTRAKATINLAELGIEGVRSRQTATGARILELPGASSGPKADLLAEKLQTALSDVARVVRPVKRVDIRISGLDDSISTEEVAMAMATIAECPRDHIKVGDIRTGPGGSGVVTVQCPVLAANSLIKRGRLLVGWSSAQVSALDPRPMRCFRCLGIGHTRPRCPSEVDRGELCFRCGMPGHKSGTCKKEPRCAICTYARRPAGHVMGGRKCTPPIVRGKPAPMLQLSSTSAQNDVTETVVMSD